MGPTNLTAYQCRASLVDSDALLAALFGEQAYTMVCQASLVDRDALPAAYVAALVEEQAYTMI